MHRGIFDPVGRSNLSELADPAEFTSPITLTYRDKERLLKELEKMLLIRFAEEGIADLVIEGIAKCPCHLGIGQEAIAVGVSANLTSSDRIFGGHRSHSHYLALGGCVDQLFAEVLGKATGCSKGMGGSMHLFGRDKGFIGSVPIVGATIPIAVGAALAAQMDKGSDIAVSYFGDGTTEEGVFHESLNFASNYNLPVLFVCENNLYSSHLDIKLRQPSDLVSRFAVSHQIRSYVVDGNDVTAVDEASKELIQKSRNGGGPGFLEAITYRWRGHVGPNEDVDVGVRRTPGDLTKWKARDPIRRLKDTLIAEKYLSETEYTLLSKKVRDRIASAVSKAKEAPYPDESMLFDTVYMVN